MLQIFNEYKSVLKAQRDESVAEVDSKYVNRINTLLQQKSLIIKHIHQQYEQQMTQIDNIIQNKLLNHLNAIKTQKITPINPLFDTEVNEVIKNEDSNSSLLENNQNENIHSNEILTKSKKWVQCDKCLKWRRVPTSVPDNELKGEWHCSMNKFDLQRANCNEPEESYDIKEAQALLVTNGCNSDSDISCSDSNSDRDADDKKNMNKIITKKWENRRKRKVYTCKDCEYATRWVGEYKNHIKTHKYKCNECEYSSQWRWELKEHIQKHNNQRYKCDQCDFVTRWKTNYDKHIKIHKHKCIYCPFSCQLKRE
eukprot:360274_1